MVRETNQHHQNLPYQQRVRGQGIKSLHSLDLTLESQTQDQHQVLREVVDLRASRLEETEYKEGLVVFTRDPSYISSLPSKQGSMKKVLGQIPKNLLRDSRLNAGQALSRGEPYQTGGQR